MEMPFSVYSFTTVNLTYNLEPVYGIVLAFAVFRENQFLGSGFYYGFGVIATALIIHIILLVKKERKLVAHAANGVS